jgi:outer membrane immunogenic protein
MKMLRASILALTASLGLSLSASAADLGGGPRGRSIKDAPYIPPFTWTGLYVGAHVGYGWSDLDWQGIGTGSDTGSGGLAGGQIGYNIQAGRLVFGIEADISSSWIDGSTSCAGLDCSHDINWLASVRGRLGTTINDNRTLLYVTGGAAWADADYAVHDPATGTLVGSFSDRHAGWVAGAGIEHMLSSNLSMRAEYLYYSFDDVNAPGALAGVTTGLDSTVQTVRFGLNFKF